MPVYEAVIEAGRLRLRPILMTTLTTVLGLLPLSFGWGAGAEIQASLAPRCYWADSRLPRW
ncbi:efflux RND transporter permease subunit [Rhodohalobacter sp.]|uniref:efflux RND transporter permease subunit n=1 Tax=Rhodohalobacter sp. TaxID=1974210 RepID=UPI002ACDBDF5|nr:efflux RND transporter permease subunit [Rhodohalobacter sp.]MDZ7756280.1 efflux RND transporter permease subunit [Rhodohalobacter sp.]